MADLSHAAYEIDVKLHAAAPGASTGGTVLFYSAEGERLGSCESEAEAARAPPAKAALALRCVFDSAAYSNDIVEILCFWGFEVCRVAHGTATPLSGSFLLALRGTTNLVDLTMECVPSADLIKDAATAVPSRLRDRYYFHYANQAVRAMKFLRAWVDTGFSPFSFPRRPEHRQRYSRITITGHSAGASIGAVLGDALVDPELCSFPDLPAPSRCSVDVYAFAPPPYLLQGAACPESQQIFTRIFVHGEDAVPSVRLLNLSGAPQPLLLLPARGARREFYHLKEGGVVLIARYEKQKGELGGDVAGVSGLVASNRDHDILAYRAALRAARPHFDAARVQAAPFLMTTSESVFAFLRKPDLGSKLHAPMLETLSWKELRGFLRWAATSLELT